MKKIVLFTALIFSTIITSCSSDSGSNSDSTISQSLNNTQWVFDNYKILQEVDPSISIYKNWSFNLGEYGVDFTMEEVQAANNLKWKDFVIIFKSGNVGLIMETLYLTEEQLLPMEWKIIDGNTIRIIYQRKSPQSNIVDNIIVEFKNAVVIDNKLSFEFEYYTAMNSPDGLKAALHFGQYTFK